MIAELAQDLTTKVKSVTSNAFGTTVKRVGLAAGAKGTDPLMQRVALPASWIIFTGDENVEITDRTMCGPTVKFSFAVKIIMDYTTEANLLSAAYPLLDEVRDTVHSSTGVKGGQWKYEGQLLEELTDRIIFEQRYSYSVSA